jgi:amidase
VVEHVMTRSVRDSAHLLAATERTGPDAVHAPSGLVTGPARTRRRIGVLRTGLTGREPDPAVGRELDRAARLLDALGHHVEPIDPPAVDGSALSRAFFTAAAATMLQVADMVTPLLGRAPGPEELEPFSLELIDWGRSLAPGALAQAERALSASGTAYLQLFDAVDVVLSPTLARPSWPVGHLAPDAGRQVLIARTEDAVSYTPIHNAAGCPAMTVPLGQHDGLPVGVQLAGPPGADGALLALAYELEEAAPWADVRPDTSWLEQPPEGPA